MNDNMYIILVGPPGCGKSQIQEIIKRNLEECGLVCENKLIRNVKDIIPDNADHVIELKQNETTT